jgi:hypothetical protein
MKQKFIIMPVLIQGPKQPGNDIDVYLRPLVEEHQPRLSSVEKQLCFYRGACEAR